MTTNCVFPPELNDKQLLAYLDGEVNKKIVSHLEGCAYCREKAETLDHFQKRMTSRLYRATCPPSLELGEYHLHMLPAPQMLVVAQHLRECPHCTREIGQLEGFLSDPEPHQTEGFLGKAKVLVARLVGGELTFTPTTALRGEGKGPLTFAAEGVIIVLDIQPAAAGRVNILGQVAADNQDDWTGALVELRRDSLLQISTTVDDLGAFQYERVTAGQHELRILPANGSVVVISNFEVPT